MAQPAARRGALLRYGLIAVVVIAAVVVAAAIGSGREKKAGASPTPQPPAPWVCSNQGPNFIQKRVLRDEPWPMTIDENKQYFADITTSCGTMRINLDAKAAPIAVNNFVHLAESGYYDGQVFHRIDRNLKIIQMGDPSCPTDVADCGTGGPGYHIKDEWPNGLKPKVGTVAMASAGTPNSSGSQVVFVVDRSDYELPRERTIFGQLADQHSLDVGQAILSIPTKKNPAAVAAGVQAPADFPANEYVYIQKIKITEKG